MMFLSSVKIFIGITIIEALYTKHPYYVSYPKLSMKEHECSFH